MVLGQPYLEDITTPHTSIHLTCSNDTEVPIRLCSLLTSYESCCVYPNMKVTVNPALQLLLVLSEAPLFVGRVTHSTLPGMSTTVFTGVPE